MVRTVNTVLLSESGVTQSAYARVIGAEDTVRGGLISGIANTKALSVSGRVVPAVSECRCIAGS